MKTVFEKNKTEYKKNQERINNRILIGLCLFGILVIYAVAKLLNINIIL